ncbi:MAG: carboxypeptidase-like regulatory domain-containing protein [Bryobacterales bacterium]|nr:carboxypeptidase-like regulatory domain-containing protein [Bryobacterales bacterium]
MSRSAIPFFATTVAVVLAVPALLAQSSTGVLSGTVQDEQDKIIASAKITLLDPAKGQTRQASADANGAFVFSQLAPSTYELSVEQPGFAKARFSDVVINADDQRSLRIKLKVAQRDETVTVTGDAPLVREAPSVATAVDRKFIENQPLNGRSFQTLINLSPGVVVTAHRCPERSVLRQRAAPARTIRGRSERKLRSSVRNLSL